MADADGGSTGTVVRVRLVWSPLTRQVRQEEVVLSGPVTARRVLLSSASLPDLERLGAWKWQPGCWGRRMGWDDEVQGGDLRIELYRPLRVDPKEARRVRYQAQGPVGRFKRRPLER